MRNNAVNIKKAIDGFYKVFNKWVEIHSIEFLQSGPGFAEYYIKYSTETLEAHGLEYDYIVRVEKEK